MIDGLVERDIYPSERGIDLVLLAAAVSAPTRSPAWPPLTQPARSPLCSFRAVGRVLFIVGVGLVIGKRDPDSVCVRDGLAGWGGWIRTSAFQNRNSPRLSAWAAGFEPLHIEII
jgi:hypothetical protein